jgi:hypothetical protein
VGCGKDSECVDPDNTKINRCKNEFELVDKKLSNGDTYHRKCIESLHATKEDYMSAMRLAFGDVEADANNIKYVSRCDTLDICSAYDVKMTDNSFMQDNTNMSAVEYKCCAAHFLTSAACLPSSSSTLTPSVLLGVALVSVLISCIL